MRRVLHFLDVNLSIEGRGHAPRVPESPVGRKRALLDVAGLSLILMGVSGISSIKSGLGLIGRGSWISPETIMQAYFLTMLATLSWLTSLLHRRASKRHVKIAGYLVGNSAVACTLPWVDGIPELLFLVSTGTALAWLAIEVCRRHGMDAAGLGFSPPHARTRSMREQAWGLGIASGGFTAIGSAASGALTIVASMWPILPALHGSQAATLGLTSPWTIVVGALHSAGVVEDVITVMAISVVLTGARCRTWLIYGIPVALNIVMHSYLGVPGVTAAAGAGLRLWLYRTYGRATPLIIGHLVVDYLAFFLASHGIIFRITASLLSSPTLYLARRLHLGSRNPQTFDDAQNADT